MRKTLILFVVKLMLASACLYAVWEWKGQLWYALFFRQVALGVYGIAGVELASLRDALDITINRFFNILPFLSLMVAAWGISWRRRIVGTLCGFAVLICWHLAFTVIVESILDAHHFDPTAYKLLSPWFLFSDALPFVLWVIISYKPLTDLLPSRSTVPGVTSNEPQ